MCIRDRRCAIDKPEEDEKNYYAVWRKVEDGTYWDRRKGVEEGP